MCVWTRKKRRHRLNKYSSKKCWKLPYRGYQIVLLVSKKSSVKIQLTFCNLRTSWGSIWFPTLSLVLIHCLVEQGLGFPLPHTQVRKESEADKRRSDALSMKIASLESHLSHSRKYTKNYWKVKIAFVGINPDVKQQQPASHKKWSRAKKSTWRTTTSTTRYLFGKRGEETLLHCCLSKRKCRVGGEGFFRRFHSWTHLNLEVLCIFKSTVFPSFNTFWKWSNIVRILSTLWFPSNFAMFPWCSPGRPPLSTEGGGGETGKGGGREGVRI